MNNKLKTDGDCSVSDMTIKRRLMQEVLFGRRVVKNLQKPIEMLVYSLLENIKIGRLDNRPLCDESKI